MKLNPPRRAGHAKSARKLPRTFSPFADTGRRWTPLPPAYTHPFGDRPPEKRHYDREIIDLREARTGRVKCIVSCTCVHAEEERCIRKVQPLSSSLRHALPARRRRQSQLDTVRAIVGSTHHISRRLRQWGSEGTDPNRSLDRLIDRSPIIRFTGRPGSSHIS